MVISLSYLMKYGKNGAKMPEIGETLKVRKCNSTRHMIWQACVDCGKERWVFLVKGIPQSQRCRPCNTRLRPCRPKGDECHNWKGGRVIGSGGYIHIFLCPDDFFYSMAKSNGYVLEHRLVVAKRLGRCLQRWELVHHKDHDRSNNIDSNLQLVTDDRHKQITILESKISYLERRVTLLEAENVSLMATQEQTV